MIRTVIVNCAPIFECSKDEETTAVETTSEAMEMGAVQPLCELSLPVSQQNHCDQSLAALYDALEGFYKPKSAA